MDSNKQSATITNNTTTNPPTPMSTRKKNHAQLPPKPNIGQKRSREQAEGISVNIPPTAASSSHARRPRRSWSRRSVSWTPEEDAQLVELVQKEAATPPSITASKTWSRVAAQLTNRTGKQCRERYLNQLKPGIRREPWSEEEERILHEVHSKIGNKWVAIAAQLPGRTDNCVKNHWNSMLRKRQRREAARKAAEKHKTANSLGLQNSSPQFNSFDLKSEGDQSIHTGIATPSVVSSMNDIPISGIPSPYTASSPLTPKRDVKLQISSLVATGTKEHPWNTPYYTRQAAQNAPLIQSASATPLTQDLCLTPNASNDQEGRSSRVYDPVSDSLQMTESIKNLTQQGFNRGIGQSTKLFVPTDASPMQCIASSSHIPGILHHAHAKGKAKPATTTQPVRRSSRLVAATRDSNQDLYAPATGPEIEKQNITNNGRRVNSSVGNPLAALAAAASSVPHSPLTPESRFSATSRSRSASPNRCDWDSSAQMKTNFSTTAAMINDQGEMEASGSGQVDLNQDKGTRKSSRINAIRKRSGKADPTE